MRTSASQPVQYAHGTSASGAFLAALNPPYRVPAEADRWVIMTAALRCLAADGAQGFAALAKATNVGLLRLAPVLATCQRAGLLTAMGAAGHELFAISPNGRALLPVLGPR